MDCKDLMIGDLVQFDEDTCVIDELRVDGMAVLVAMNTDLTSVDGDQVDVEELYPIPLNAEMLEKNTIKMEGFTGWLYWLDLKEQCYVRKYDGEYTFMYKRGFADACIPIEFVHQLQHCLKMFGISKEIVL